MRCAGIFTVKGNRPGRDSGNWLSCREQSKVYSPYYYCLHVPYVVPSPKSPAGWGEPGHVHVHTCTSSSLCACASTVVRNKLDGEAILPMAAGM